MKGLQRLAMIGLTVLSLGLVAAALTLAGGPGRARAEVRDQARLDDLRRIETQILCLARQEVTVTPPLDTTPSCPQQVPTADAQGVPYRIEPLEDGNIRLCAGFELGLPDQRLRSGQTTDAMTPDAINCLVTELRDTDTDTTGRLLPSENAPPPETGPSLVPLN